MFKAFKSLTGTEISKGGFLILLFRIVGVFCFLSFNLLISNYFGAAVYGDYLIFTMVLNIAGLTFVLGLDSFVLQQVPPLLESKNLASAFGLDRNIEKILLLTIVLAIGGLGLLSLIIPSLFPNQLYFFLLILIIGPFIIFRYRTECIRSTKKMMAYGLLTYLSIPLLSLILFFLFKNNFESNTGIIVYSIAILIASVLSLIIWKRSQAFGLKSNGSSFDLKSVLKQSLPFMFIGMLMFMNDWADKLFLRVLSDNAQVGLYGSAFRIVQFSLLPLLSINAIAAPRFAESFANQSPQEFKKLVTQTTRLILLVSIPLFIVIALASKSFLSLFGEEFIIAQMPLLILLIGQFVNVAAGPVGILLKMTKQQNILLYIVFASVCLNMILNFILIPNFGLNGAAIATSISIIFSNVASIIYIKRKFGFFTFQFLKT